MTRFESFMRRHSQLSWLLSAIVIILMIFWAGQLKLKGHIPTNHEFESQKTHIAQMIDFMGPIQNRAHRLGRQYDARQYFADLKEIQLKEQELGFPTHNDPIMAGKRVSASTVFYLHEKLTAYQRVSANAAQEIFLYNRLLREHLIWLRDHKIEQSATGGQELTKLARKAGWFGVAHWLAIFYLRMILLSLVIFLIRMIQRRGIIETFLADKLAFILAPLFWIYFLWKYPYNVVREIRVETELRRLGSLFRPLRSSERVLVREIAASSKYHEWLAIQGSKRNLKRTLAIALLATVTMYLFVPIVSASGSRSPNQQAIATISFWQAGLSHYLVTADDADGSSSSAHFADLPPKIFLHYSITSIPLVPLVITSLQDGYKTIYHIPVIGWLVSRFIRTIQLAGEIRFLRRQSKGENNVQVYNSFADCGNLAAIDYSRG